MLTKQSGRQCINENFAHKVKEKTTGVVSWHDLKKRPYYDAVSDGDSIERVFFCVSVLVFLGADTQRAKSTLLNETRDHTVPARHDVCWKSLQCWLLHIFCILLCCVLAKSALNQEPSSRLEVLHLVWCPLGARVSRVLSVDLYATLGASALVATLLFSVAVAELIV